MNIPEALRGPRARPRFRPCRTVPATGSAQPAFVEVWDETTRNFFADAAEHGPFKVAPWRSCASELLLRLVEWFFPSLGGSRLAGSEGRLAESGWRIDTAPLAASASLPELADAGRSAGFFPSTKGESRYGSRWPHFFYLILFSRFLQAQVRKNAMSDSLMPPGTAILDRAHHRP